MTLLSTNMDVRITQGDTPLLSFSIFNPDGSQFSTLTSGLEAEWTLEQNGNVVLTKSVAFATPNLCQVQLANADTVYLSGIFNHTLVISDNNGNILHVKKIEANVVGDHHVKNIFQIDRA